MAGAVASPLARQATPSGLPTPTRAPPASPPASHATRPPPPPPRPASPPPWPPPPPPSRPPSPWPSTWPPSPWPSTRPPSPWPSTRPPSPWPSTQRPPAARRGQQGGGSRGGGSRGARSGPGAVSAARLLHRHHLADHLAQRVARPPPPPGRLLAGLARLARAAPPLPAPAARVELGLGTLVCTLVCTLLPAPHSALQARREGDARLARPARVGVGRPSLLRSPG